MRRHDCVPLVARMQQEIVDVLAQAANRAEYLRLLESRAAPILDVAIARLRDGDVTAADLAISKRLTQYPEQYAHATHNAIAAQSLQARGVRLRPGETVEYVIADAGAKVPCERVRPLAMASDNLSYDAREYERFLREAFQVFVPPS
jgi:DNA polymerase elongation subunit (family B)